MSGRLIVTRRYICIWNITRYDNVTLSPLLLPARVTNRSHSTYGSSTRSDSHRAVFCPNSVGYKSTMDWCSVYLTPQGLPKYIYLSLPLIFPTTYNGIRTKNRPVWITPGAAPIRSSITRVYVRCHGGQETIFEYEIDHEGRNRYCNTYFVSPLLKNCRE
jgi:hypothetical protein